MAEVRRGGGGEEEEEGSQTPGGLDVTASEPGGPEHGPLRPLPVCLPAQAPGRCGCFCWAAWRARALGGERDKIQKKGLRVARCSIVQHRCPHLIHSRSIPLLRPPVRVTRRDKQTRTGTRGRTPSRSRTHTSLPALAHTPPGHTPAPACRPSFLALVRLHPASPLGQRIGHADPLPPSVDIKSSPRAPLSLPPPSVLLLFTITGYPQHPSQPAQQLPAANLAHASGPPPFS